VNHSCARVAAMSRGSLAAAIGIRAERALNQRQARHRASDSGIAHVPGDSISVLSRHIFFPPYIERSLEIKNNIFVIIIF